MAIYGRLDRLPWSRFHWLVVVALGITWILDGLEVTIAGAVAGAWQQSPSLQLSATEIGLLASAYLAGTVSGAGFFGYLPDRLGRKGRRLFDTVGCRRMIASTYGASGPSSRSRRSAAASAAYLTVSETFLLKATFAVAVVSHFIDGCGTEALAGIAIFLRTSYSTYVRVERA